VIVHVTEVLNQHKNCSDATVVHHICVLLRLLVINDVFGINSHITKTLAMASLTDLRQAMLPNCANPDVQLIIDDTMMPILCSHAHTNGIKDAMHGIVVFVIAALRLHLHIHNTTFLSQIDKQHQTDRQGKAFLLLWYMICTAPEYIGIIQLH